MQRATSWQLRGTRSTRQGPNPCLSKCWNAKNSTCHINCDFLWTPLARENVLPFSVWPVPRFCWINEKPGDLRMSEDSLNACSLHYIPHIPVISFTDPQNCTSLSRAFFLWWYLMAASLLLYCLLAHLLWDFFTSKGGLLKLNPLREGLKSSQLSFCEFLLIISVVCFYPEHSSQPPPVQHSINATNVFHFLLHN